MKFKGAKLEPPKPIDVVLPRGDDVLHFKVQAIFNYDEFEALVPMPMPPMKTLPGKAPVPDPTDETFITARHDYFVKRRGWMYLKAYSATPELEWETMSLKDPTTWSHDNFVNELKASGFTVMEISYLIRAVERANAMDEKHMDEVRARFLAQEAAAKTLK